MLSFTNNREDCVAFWMPSQCILPIAEGHPNLTQGLVVVKPYEKARIVLSTFSATSLNRSSNGIGMNGTLIIGVAVYRSLKEHTRH